MQTNALARSVLLRGGPGDDVIVLLNFANRAYESYTFGFPRAGIWQVRFNSDWSGYSADFGNWTMEKARAFGTSARQSVCDHFHIARMAQETIDCFELARTLRPEATAP